jgi:hypothetical protein
MTVLQVLAVAQALKSEEDEKPEGPARVLTREELLKVGSATRAKRQANGSKDPEPEWQENLT